MFAIVCSICSICRVYCQLGQRWPKCKRIEAFFSSLTGPVSVALVTEKCNIFCFLLGWGNRGCPDLFLRSLQLCSWKAHKLYQIILTLVRACSSKAQLIMVYWFMAPSCMAQASFCVLLGCMPRSTHKFKGRNFWLDTTFSRLLSDSPNKFLKLGTRALPQLRTWHIPTKEPGGRAPAAGRFCRSPRQQHKERSGRILRRAWAQNHRNKQKVKKNMQIFHNVGLYEVRSCSWPTLDTLLQLDSKELNICHAVWLFLILMLWSDTQHMSPPSNL
jgi:hypothetical protein